MFKTSNKIGVIFFGPQGSGKGTQAKLLADKFGFFHFDTGDYLRKLLYDPKLQKNKIIRMERQLNDSGILNTPAFVLTAVKRRVAELLRLKQSIVFSGSPRTFFEAFGNKNTEGLIKALEKGYGRNNVFIFILNIPKKESIKRTAQRPICSTCGALLLNPKFQAKNFKFKMCPFCGGKIIHRVDDNEKTILVRLKEYKEQTQPIFKELKKRKYKVFKIDGTPMPHKIHQSIVAKISK